MLCVRYRYDETRKARFKTVKLIVEERPWEPPFRFRDDDFAPVTVKFDEKDLRERLRKAPAKWDPEAKVWMVPYGKIRGTDSGRVSVWPQKAISYSYRQHVEFLKK